MRNVILLGAAGVFGLLTTPAFALALQDEGRRSAEAEQGRRRSAEAEEGKQRSAEAEEGRRRSAESEEGRRRSAEADEGKRRSAEAEEGSRKSPETEKRAERNPLENFKPQTRREEELYKMIMQLQREVAALRNEVRGEQRGRDGDRKREGNQERAGHSERERDGERRDQSVELGADWKKSKVGGVFQAYDKNGDESVNLEEWLAMTNGNISDARRRLQTERFLETNPGDDKVLSPREFARWWDQKEGGKREGGNREGGKREGGDRNQSRESEGQRKSAEREGDRRSPEAEEEERRRAQESDRR